MVNLKYLFTMKRFIRRKLLESLNIPFRLPKNISISNEEIDKLKTVDWSTIKVVDLGGSSNVAHLSVVFPFKTIANKSIVIDIQVIKNTLYQVHIQLPEAIRNIGLGYKIYKALIKDLGHIYSGSGRVLNSNINNIWNKLFTDPTISCKAGGLGKICVDNSVPNRNELLSIV